MVLRFVVYSFALYFLMSCSSGQGENRSVTDKHVDRSTNLYATNCAACHGEDGKLKAGGASDLSKGTIDREQIIEVIKMGRKGMPPHDHITTDDKDFEDLADFVINLREE